jgi:hypothetical protein
MSVDHGVGAGDTVGHAGAVGYNPMIDAGPPGTSRTRTTTMARVTAPDPQATGRRTADELVRRLAADDGAGADELLAGLTEVRELVFVGAGLTAIARADGRQLPPAQRAQASTRQLALGQLRDRHRGDPEGLRTWLRRSAEEVLFLRALREAAARVAG